MKISSIPCYGPMKYTLSDQRNNIIMWQTEFIVCTTIPGNNFSNGHQNDVPHWQQGICCGNDVINTKSLLS